MSKNLGDKVSRVLDSKSRNFTSVLFQKHRPPLDSEFNLLQELHSEKIAENLRISCPSGFLDIGEVTGAPEDRSNLTASWRNAVKFKGSSALVNGWVIPLGKGTNQVQQGSLNTIWEDISNEDDEIAIILPQAPTTAHRQDLVFLEVWESRISTTDVVFYDGFIQSVEDAHSNDLVDSDLNIETSQRTQVQFRFRTVAGVDFESYREGLGHSGVRAQGPLPQANINYTFEKHPSDPGLYIAGNGDAQSKQDLNTTDGFIYAIPVLRVHRKNRTGYSRSNQNGSAYSLSQGVLSDRPDGLFYDEINISDIEDLRHTVSLTGFNFDSLLEENLNKLWSNKLPGELKRSDLDENVVGTKIIQVDAVSNLAVSGADSNDRFPDNFRRSFTDGRHYQRSTRFITNANLNSGSLWFAPLGRQENSWEYEFWDEDKFYTRKLDSNYTPRIFTYNQSTGVRTEIFGGQWLNLGEFRTYDYIDDDCKNKIEYIPSNPSDVQGRDVLVMLDLVTREGGGIGSTRGGFNYNIDQMLEAVNLRDGSPVEFNHYKSIENEKQLVNPRSVQNLIDSALTRSISRFEEATIPTNNFTEVYKGGCIEIKYHVLSTGSTSLVIPNQVYGRTVYGVHSIFNVTTQTWLTPNINRVSNGFDISGIISATGNVLQFTLLCGNYTCDYIPHTRGISNIANNIVLTNAINIGDTTGVFNVKTVLNQCDAIISNTGFYNGVNYYFVAYVNNRMVFLDSLEGLGTPVIKYNLTSPSEVSGQISLHLLGYYNPIEADSLVFTYKRNTYRGIIQDKVSINTFEKFKVVKVDPNITTTTAGTGYSDQYVEEDLLGMVSTLPINTNTREYNFFGSDIYSPLASGNSAVRRVPGRGASKNDFSENSEALKEGQILTLGLSNDTPMLRGAVLIEPHIHERGYDLPIPVIRDDNGDLLDDPETGQPYDIIFDRDFSAYNHMTQWSAIVEGLDSFKGELFLLVITTTSTVYNEEEASEYEYLLDKDLYRSTAFGKGRETILNNKIPIGEVNQRLGRKILGAVDVIPLNGRPLKY